MSIIHTTSTNNRDVEFEASAFNQTSYGINNDEDLSAGDSTKGEASKEGSKEVLTSGAAEKNQNESPPEWEDPFGNEENSDIKYKTMVWWYVSSA
jgi:hypothetical protein